MVPKCFDPFDFSCCFQTLLDRFLEFDGMCSVSVLLIRQLDGTEASGILVLLCILIERGTFIRIGRFAVCDNSIHKCGDARLAIPDGLS
jgi:hypothetical protein